MRDRSIGLTQKMLWFQPGKYRVGVYLVISLPGSRRWVVHVEATGARISRPNEDVSRAPRAAEGRLLAFVSGTRLAEGTPHRPRHAVNRPPENRPAGTRPRGRTPLPNRRERSTFTCNRAGFRWGRTPLPNCHARATKGAPAVRVRAWARPRTGCVRSVGRHSATGWPSASAAGLCSGTSRTLKTSCPSSAHSAEPSSALVVRPATRASALRSRSSVRPAVASYVHRSSSAFRSGALSPDLREADHRDGRVVPDLTVVELAEEVSHLLGSADLRVVVLDLPR